MMRRALAVIAALAVVVIPLSACSASTDREAVRSDQSVDGVNGGGSTLEACAEYSEQPSCVLDATQTGVTVLNGSSLLFGGAGSEPAESVELTKVCWSPAGEVEPIDCDTDGEPMTPGLVTQATISGYPALSFSAEKISDPSPDAPEDGVYPLPALIYLNVDGREVMVEIACCTTLP